MPTPKKGYFTKAGKRVPGTTTITGRFKKSDALLWWAWDQGCKGLDFRETKQKAADAGTAAHAMIEAWKLKTEPDLTLFDEPTLKKANAAYGAFMAWAGQTKFEIQQTELGLVSEKYEFGGTLDAALMNGQLVLGDWKTSGAVYSDMLVQVAGGYSLLWEENFPDQKLEGAVIVRFSKPKHEDDPISFHHHWYSKEIFPIAQRQFILFRESYELDKRLEGLV